ncbi:MAG: histidine phosphatase family protein [Rhodocyclaceae bacterium]|jgi:probable phosphoglycerate mutase|nr:histidine phosphatase family protein [Rhodocyclaceae bacterium]
MTRLCLIRHGETDWNAGKRIQGQIDIPLSALGHAQARAVGNALKDEDFAAIYASDLTRTRQTAEATAHLARLPLLLDAGFRERHYGIFQGLTYAECEARHPAAYARHKSRDPHFAPEGGESLLTFAGRLAQAFDAIVRRHPGQSVAIFTHGGVLDIAYRQATGMALSAPRDFAIPNCAINWIEVEAGCWTLLSWAERGHLDKGTSE